MGFVLGEVVFFLVFVCLGFVVVFESVYGSITSLVEKYCNVLLMLLKFPLQRIFSAKLQPLHPVSDPEGGQPAPALGLALRQLLNQTFKR